MQNETSAATGPISRILLNTSWGKVAELLLPFALAFVLIFACRPWMGDHPIRRQGVVWVANVIMLVTVWLGLWARGQTWRHFGLTFQFPGWKALMHLVGLSLVVFVIAILAFVLGGILMGMIMGAPQQADLSGYNYLAGDLPMLILALIGVFIVSSFGEEVIYRAFLITRIEELGAGSRRATWLAVVASSVIFGFVHYSWGLFGIVQTFLMGLALAVAYWRMGRNLWINIIAHAYMDAILMVQMYLGG